jgi:hypothetical protein
MNYHKVLQEIYYQKGLSNNLTKEYEDYLKDAIEKIDSLWFENIKQITTIKLVVLAEAPMWGKKESYIYNPEAEETDFFRCEHLKNKYPLECHGKSELIFTLREKGIVFLDVSPFPLNQNETSICYNKRKTIKSQSKKIGIRDYKKIMRDTFNDHMLPKLRKIYKVCGSGNPTYVYRYKRVMGKHTTLYELSKSADITIPETGVACISDPHNYGNIDQMKLDNVLP